MKTPTVGGLLSTLPRKAILFVFLALAVVCVPAAGFSQEAPRKPNIVFILTDDQDVASINAMPNVKSSLAAAGTTFENSFVTTPQCCPSRATFLTGKYGHNHGVQNNKLPMGGARKFAGSGADRNTIATRMKAAGYSTGYMGKYLNEYESGYVPPGWDRWSGWMGDYNSEREGRPGKYWINENGRRKIYERARLHDTDLLARQASGFIQSKNGAPWFLVIAPNAPHSPSYSARRHENLFQRTPLPRSPSFNESDVSDKPYYVRQSPRISAATRTAITKSYRQRLRSLRSVDEMVARVIGTLRGTGQLDNTYVVYASDNGWSFGAHRLIGKGTPYEESIRVPLIVRGPGVPAGQTRSEIVANTDWAPTIAGWGGTDMPDADGRTLAPLLGGSTPPEWRERILIEFWLRPFSGVRDNDHTYVEHGTGERELYDLAADPYQFSSLHGQSARLALMTELSIRLDALKSCAGREACGAAEGTAPESIVPEGSAP